MKKLWQNAIRSWVTTTFGTVAGVPQIIEGVNLITDSDKTNNLAGIIMMITGAGLVVMGFVARDGNKSSEDVGAH